MEKTLKRWLFWTPRILSILFAVFVSLFALDVFSEGYGFWRTILALLIHLIPTWIILVLLVISWRWEWVGGILFIALGVLSIVKFCGQSNLVTYLIMIGPLFLIGVLFLVDGLSGNY